MHGNTRQGLGFRALAETVAAITAPALNKRGLSNAVLAAEWPRVVGDTLARHTAPEKLVFAPRRRSEGTLHVRIATSAMALEVQHAEPVIIERINGYFGFTAVARLRLRHAPMASTTRPLRGNERPTADGIADHARPPDEKALERSVAGIADGGLKAALLALGRTMSAEPTPTSGDAEPAQAATGRRR